MRNNSWKWAVGITLVGGLLTLALLPTLLASRWIYQPLVDRLAAERFTLTLDRVQIGWLRPLEFETIKLQVQSSDLPQGQELPPLLSIQSIRSNRSLLGYLWGGRDLGTVEIESPNIDIRLLEEGSNLQRLIQALQGPNQSASSSKSSDKKIPPSLDVEIVIHGLHVTVTEQGGQALVVVPPLDARVAYRSLDVDSQVIVQPARILDRVKVTPELIKLGLANAVPLLAQSADFDGLVSLDTELITIPLSKPETASGSAALTLYEVRSRPTNPTILSAIDFVGRLFRKDLPHELIFVDGSTIKVSMTDGLVHHQGVRAGLPRVDQRLQLATHGTVGLLDRSLNLNLEIPVPVEQLAKRTSVKELGVPSMTLPIRGTLDEPVIDWGVLRRDSAELLAVISGLLGDEAPLVGGLTGALSEVAGGQADAAIDTGIDLVKQLLQRRAQRSQQHQQQSGATAGSAEDGLMQSSSSNAASASEGDEAGKSGRLRDGLRKLLRGKDDDDS